MKKIIQIVGSAHTMAVLLILYAAALGAATFVEHSTSTAFAREWFYNSWWMFCLQGLLAANFIAMASRFKLYSQRKWGVLLLHYGFVVILGGAMISHLTAKEGILHLRQGESSAQLLNDKGVALQQLPFSVTLSKFEMSRYGGSGSPQSYRSYVIVDGVHSEIYMNNVLSHGGWRFYQSSFDSDEKGSYLLASYDGFGSAVTYAGYILLALGMVGALCGKKSRFRRLLSSLSVFLVAFSAYGSDPVVAKFERLMVQTPDGQVQAVDSYAEDLLRKIHRAKTYNGLSASEVLLGITTNPIKWSNERFIVDNNGNSVAFADVIDADGAYTLSEQIRLIYAKPARERSKADKELLKFDERINILDNLFSGRMLALFPLAGSRQWYSAGDDLAAFAAQPKDSLVASKTFGWFALEYLKGNTERAIKVVDMISIYQKAKGGEIHADRVEAQILYNKLDIFKWTSFGYMGCGLVLILLLIAGVMRQSLALKYAALIFVVIGLLLFLWQMAGIGLRWYVSGRAPWTNAYESIVYVSWATALAGTLFLRRSKITFALSIFLAGTLLFVSTLSWMDPAITPLAPVLNSYWLIIHVAVITASYGFFGIGFLLGVVALILMCARKSGAISLKIKELTTVNTLALTLGLVLMSAGTFLGAIWANESWGRYWGWDPKETWALITMVAYAFVIHSHLIKPLRSPYAFAVMSIVALGAVLMTFFGVNYYLSGMHSYGADSAPPALTLIFWVYGALFVLAIYAFARLSCSKSDLLTSNPQR